MPDISRIGAVDRSLRYRQHRDLEQTAREASAAAANTQLEQNHDPESTLGSQQSPGRQDSRNKLPIRLREHRRSMPDGSEAGLQLDVRYPMGGLVGTLQFNYVCKG